jgi:hypothetical protein
MRKSFKPEIRRFKSCTYSRSGLLSLEKSADNGAAYQYCESLDRKPPVRG